jgi:hypothetical protein
MTNTSKLALQFARECLGWHDAYLLAGAILNGQTSQIFQYEDLEQVIIIVGDWAARTVLGTLFLTYFPPHYSCRIVGLKGSTDGGFIVKSAHEAIFIACLEWVQFVQTKPN